MSFVISSFQLKKVILSHIFKFKNCFQLLHSIVFIHFFIE